MPISPIVVDGMVFLSCNGKFVGYGQYKFFPIIFSCNGKVVKYEGYRFSPVVSDGMLFLDFDGISCFDIKQQTMPVPAQPFEAVFTIAGLLAVAYLLRRR